MGLEAGETKGDKKEAGVAVNPNIVLPFNYPSNYPRASETAGAAKEQLMPEGVEKADLADLLEEVKRKSEGDVETLEKVKRELAEAAGSGKSIHDLQGGVDPVQMARMFLVQQKGQRDPVTFSVDFSMNGKVIEKFNRNVGAANIFPPTVIQISVEDARNPGHKITGVRKTVNGRTGYYDENNRYIPVWHGDKVTVERTGGYVQSEKKEEEENKNFQEMDGTHWEKGEDAPVEDRLPSVNVDVTKRETLKNAVMTTMNVEGVGKVRLNIPVNLDSYNQPPQYVFYYHGNGGQDSNVKMVNEQVRRLREKGTPVILVYPLDERGHWAGCAQKGTFSRTLAAARQQVREQTGRDVPPRNNVHLSAFSGGGFGMGYALREINEDDRLGANVRSVTAFDSTYGQNDRNGNTPIRAPMAEFAASDPSRKITSYYTPHLEAANRDLQKRTGSNSNVKVSAFHGHHGETVGEMENMFG